MTRTKLTAEQDRAKRATLRELTQAELRLVTGGQEMEHGGRVRP